MEIVEDRMDRKMDEKLDARFADFSDTMDKKFEVHAKTINANTQSQIAQLRKEFKIKTASK